jgi:hypothetical protein
MIPAELTRLRRWVVWRRSAGRPLPWAAMSLLRLLDRIASVMS